MSKSFEIEGKMKVINDVQSFDSGFTKREFVIETEDDRFPQMIKFECVRDKTSLTDGIEIDEPVKITFDIRGNEYKGRYYVNLNAWKLEKGGGGGGDSAAPQDYSDEDGPPSHMTEPPADTADPDDDIPF